MNLTDEQWLLLQPIFPTRPPRESNRGRPACSDRAILDAIFWVRRTGSPWRELPIDYPSYLTCHRRELEWTSTGLMRRILSMLMDDLLHRGGLDVSLLIQDGLITAKKRGRRYYVSAHPDLVGTWQLSTALIFIAPHLKRIASRRQLKMVYSVMKPTVRELDG